MFLPQFADLFEFVFLGGIERQRLRRLAFALPALLGQLRAAHLEKFTGVGRKLARVVPDRHDALPKVRGRQVAQDAKPTPRGLLAVERHERGKNLAQRLPDLPKRMILGQVWVLATATRGVVRRLAETAKVAPGLNRVHQFVWRFHAHPLGPALGQAKR